MSSNIFVDKNVPLFPGVTRQSGWQYWINSSFAGSKKLKAELPKGTTEWVTSSISALRHVHLIMALARLCYPDDLTAVVLLHYGVPRCLLAGTMLWKVLVNIWNSYWKFQEIQQIHHTYIKWREKYPLGNSPLWKYVLKSHPTPAACPGARGQQCSQLDFMCCALKTQPQRMGLSRVLGAAQFWCLGLLLARYSCWRGHDRLSARISDAVC